MLRCFNDTAVTCIDDIPRPYETFEELMQATGTTFKPAWYDLSTFSYQVTSNMAVKPARVVQNYSITNICGYTATCQRVITVEDLIPPVLICPPPATVKCISELPKTTTLAGFIAAGGDTADNCRIDPATFRIVSTTKVQMPNAVRLSRVYEIADWYGNKTTCEQTIFHNDTIPPFIVCADTMINLDATGKYVIRMEDILSSVSDNCTAVADLEIVAFPPAVGCDDVGKSIAVRITVTDEAGNSSMCTANITVGENLPPVTICKDTVVYLNSSGRATITPAWVDGGSWDNCGIDKLTIDKSLFTCEDAGNNVSVRLTATDAAGNVSTCTAFVTVKYSSIRLRSAGI